MVVNTSEGPGRRLSKDDRRAQLLAVGQALFDAYAYDDVSMLEVARSAGISHGLIYHYFPSKEAFFVAALEGALTDMLGVTAMDPDMPAPEAAEQGIRNLIDHVSAHSRVFTSAHRGTAAELPGVRAVVDNARARFADQILAPVVRERGKELPNTRFALSAYFGLCERALLDWLDDRSRITRASLERLLFASFGTAISTGLEQDLPDAETERAHWATAFRAYFRLA